jgi:hypothetical protein
MSTGRYDVKEYLEAALRLHHHIASRHWNGQAIVGPDPIGKINWRVTRFIRSYTGWLPWRDNWTYLQGQGYWIKANLKLFELTGDTDYLGIASRCADYMVSTQPADGAWPHPPIRGRRGFISTVEIVWACRGLVAAYQKLGNPAHLNAALKGYDSLVNVVGFRRFKDGLAINYHAHTTELVPNVTAMLLALVADIHQATGDSQYLKSTGEMLHFLKYSQMKNGELEYIYDLRPHFQCYQYNSFEFLDLAHYYQLTGDENVRPILNEMASFLATGVTGRGSCRYNCFSEVPEVKYWTAALAAALRAAHELELGDYLSFSERAYRYLLTQQRPHGEFDFSERNYGLLHDRRSYPRYLAMILNFLALRSQLPATDEQPLQRSRNVVLLKEEDTLDAEST